MRLKLIHNAGFKWFSNGKIYAKGYIYDSKGGHYNAEEIVNYISNFDSEELIEFIKNANGCFSIIWEKSCEVIVSVDRIRSIPLFYNLENNEIIVSDDVGYIANHRKIKSFDKTAYAFIQLGGFAPGNRTLFSSIFQLMGGQALHIKNIFEPVSGEPFFYYKHIHHREKKPQKDLEEEFSIILNNTFERLIHSAKGRSIVIPLSGGSDSRLIIAMLKKLNYEKVICYTYGRQDSYETQIAEKVARRLNYPWHFIHYKDNLFKKYFDDESKSYREYAGMYSCSPLEQEYFAIRELSSNKLIPEDSIVVPGYSADLPAGSYFPNKRQLELITQNKLSALEFIIEKHFKKSRKIPEFHLVETELLAVFMDFKWNNTDEFVSDHENWFTLNKVSKYVVNGTRTYEYFGYQWRLPFWDNEFINFFYRISNEERIDKRFYKKYLSDFIFKEFNIDFSPPIFDRHFTHSSPLNTIKYFTPTFIREIVKPVLIKKKDRDVNALSELFGLVNQKIYNGKFNVKEKDINYILACWYLKEMEKSLK